MLVHSVPISTLKIGDVITYANSLHKGSTISHRIIKMYKLGGIIPSFITKGDANPSADMPVVGGQVQGKVMWHVPYIGTALAWSHTLVGILIIIYIPAFVVMFEESKRLIAYYRQYAPYKTALILAREKADAKPMSKFGAAAVLSALLLIGSIFVSFPALALLKSNTVSLINNKLTSASPVITPPSGGNTTTTTTNTNTTCQSNNNITVTNNTNQSSTTGDASTNGNTTGGNASSGNATNNNSSNTNIIITGC
ncbi:MAG: signal peptidase [Candidatus Saccharibacteria bacterium]|nr:signal peptidase [Candidatus Saccharibacteria bacterium]